MLLKNIKGMTATSNILQCQKALASKIQVPCPESLKIHNQGMVWVDLAH